MSITPEPWTMTKCQCGHSHCSSWHVSPSRSGMFDKEDAQLIVAAPKMLAALRDAETALSRDFHPESYARKTVRAAIAEATKS